MRVYKPRLGQTRIPNPVGSPSSPALSTSHTHTHHTSLPPAFQTMLAARSSSSSAARRLLFLTPKGRTFATVVDAASGVKVAAVDNGDPTSAVTFLVKAGSRYETKPGVAHALQNFAFKVRERNNRVLWGLYTEV